MRFPPPIIQHTIWLYLRFTLSYRDVEELLAERGFDISYETARRWVLKFGPMNVSSRSGRAMAGGGRGCMTPKFVVPVSARPRYRDKAKRKELSRQCPACRAMPPANLGLHQLT
jgi:hypothetical protein